MKSIAHSCMPLMGLLVSVGIGFAQETQPAPAKVAWKHGLTFQVRKAGQDGFASAPKFGAEIFLDRDLNQLVYIAETGAIGLAPATKVREGDPEAPRLFHGLEVRVRPVGESSWDKAAKFGAEVFRDPNADTLVYLSEKGSLATLSAAGINPADKIKDPAWFHGLELKVRKASEKEFNDRTKKIALEVYKDENTGQLIYVTDSGHVAIVPARDATKPAEVKGPTWYHAFELKVRKADEKEFSKDTRAYGFEVYKDENANNLIYLCETGAIAVVPSGGLTKPASSKEPKWQFGRSFRVRPAADPDFNDKTPRFGAEIYKDENSGNSVYLTEQGYFAVGAGK